MKVAWNIGAFIFACLFAGVALDRMSGTASTLPVSTGSHGPYQISCSQVAYSGVVCAIMDTDRGEVVRWITR